MEKELREKVEVLVGEFADKLKGAVCIGYSFFKTDIKRNNKGLWMTASLGMKVLVDGEVFTMGADVEFERGTVQGKGSDRAWLNIDYIFSKGRDFKIQYYDEVSNHPGNDKSINGIAISDMLFKIIYKMSAPIFEDSPIPMIG